MQLVFLLVVVWICQGFATNQTAHHNGKLITSICNCFADHFQPPQNGCKIALDDTLTLNAVQNDSISTKFTLLLDVDQSMCDDINRTLNFIIPERPKSSQVWLYGIISVAVISGASALGVFCIPLCKKSCYQGFLTLFMGLAVGSLLGSALFHLIPQSLGLADREDKTSYLKEMAMIMTGSWVFFIVDRILKLKSIPVSIKASVINLESVAAAEHTALCQVDQQCNGEKMIDHETNNNKNVKRKNSKITPLSWMIILGDAIHNFIDGLTIGAAYNNSLASGISLTVAVFCEEAPHELGDLAVLLNSGMSLKKAVMFNLLSALTSFIGLAIGILITPIDTDSYIFAFAGGMFLYISLGAMLREMNEISEEANKISRQKSIYVLILQNIGLIIGAALLYTLALFQDDINVVIFF